MGIGWPGGSSGGGGTFPPTAPTIVPAWFNIGEFSFSDFSTDGTQYDLGAYTIPPRGVLHGVLLTPITQFSGVGLTSYTINCGIPGELERFTSPFDVAVIAPGDTVKQLTAPLLDQVDHENATSFRVVATSDGTGLDSVTAGSFRLDILISLSPSPSP